MGVSQKPPEVAPRPAPTWAAALDVTAKALVLILVARVALDPAWGNLEGKAPGVRAVIYPMLAFLVPAVFFVRRSRGEYPWLADLLLTVPSFSDVLGNRLDLYDRVRWFDDFVHFANAGLVSAAILLLSGAGAAPLRHRLELAVASGLTASLAWELWEYYAFVTRSKEAVSAYADTLGDLTMGLLGALAAAVLVRAPGEADVRRGSAEPDGEEASPTGSEPAPTVAPRTVADH